MRSCAALLIVMLFAAVRADENVKPLSPEEAAKKVNEKCTVQMEVKTVGMAKSGKVVFLNSESDFRSPKNFTIMLGEQALEKLKKANIDDAGAHYKGKTVRVTGTVKLYQDKPEIVVNDPEEVVIVEKK
jgi:DNA/RNA endonuclease YhcR with UshA esterase domain